MTEESSPVRRVLVDPRRNTLTLDVGDAEDGLSWREVAALVDVGEGGRLLGVEVALPGDATRPAVPNYLSLVEADDPLARGIPATGRIATGAAGRLLAVEIPRRGPGYEIAFPSGNQ